MNHPAEPSRVASPIIQKGKVKTILTFNFIQVTAALDQQFNAWLIRRFFLLFDRFLFDRLSFGRGGSSMFSASSIEMSFSSLLLLLFVDSSVSTEDHSR